MSLSNLTLKELKVITNLVTRKERLTSTLQAIYHRLEAFGGGGGQPSSINGSQAPARRGRKKRMGRPPGSKNRRKAAATAKATRLPVSARPSKAAPAKSTRGGGKKRGGVQEAVWAALKAAGKPGININDLASKVGSTKNSLNVLLYRSRKKMKELRKLVKPGVWGWDG